MMDEFSKKNEYAKKYEFSKEGEFAKKDEFSKKDESAKDEFSKKDEHPVKSHIKKAEKDRWWRTRTPSKKLCDIIIVRTRRKSKPI